MKKKKLTLSALLISGLFSAAVCFFLFKAFFYAGWRFDILKENHWHYLINKWNAGWVMNTPREMLFFAALVSAVPVWLISWVLTYIMPWKAILLFPLTVMKKRKAEKLLQKSIEAAKGPENIQAALAAKKTQPAESAHKVPKISAEKISKIDKLRGKSTHSQPSAAQRPSQPAQNTGTFEEPNYMPERSATPAGGNAAAQQPSPDQKLQTLQAWSALAELMEKSGIFIFREMKIGSYDTNLIVATGESVFLMSEGPKLGSSWTVCEDEEIPVWKDGKDALASPLRPLLEARDKVRDTLFSKFPQYSSMSVNACLVLDHGEITNTKELIEKLEAWDMSVLRTGTCRTSDLPEVNALVAYIRSQNQSTQEINDAVADTILALMETGSDF